MSPSVEPGATIDEVVAARGQAYDEHYRTLWEARAFDRAALEDALGDFLQRERGGNINGNEIEWALKQVGVPGMAGRVVLDYCCGTGMTAIYFALLGATVYAFDRSDAAVEIARRSAALSGVADRIHFFVVDARRLPFAGRSFDVAFCQSALHIVAAYDECPVELARVLKLGGTAAFCEEALGYNVFVSLVRYFLRRKYVQCGGRPLTYRDVRRFGTPFARTRIQHFNLTLQIKTFMASRIERPSVRRWLQRLDRMDRRVLAVAPWLGFLCGKIAVTYEAPQGASPTPRG